ELAVDLVLPPLSEKPVEVFRSALTSHAGVPIEGRGSPPPLPPRTSQGLDPAVLLPKPVPPLLTKAVTDHERIVVPVASLNLAAPGRAISPATPAPPPPSPPAFEEKKLTPPPPPPTPSRVTPAATMNDAFSLTVDSSPVFASPTPEKRSRGLGMMF